MQHTSVQQWQSPRRGLCCEQLRIWIVQIAQLDTAHSAPRSVLVGPFDGIVFDLVT